MRRHAAIGALPTKRIRFEILRAVLVTARAAPRATGAQSQNASRTAGQKIRIAIATEHPARNAPSRVYAIGFIRDPPPAAPSSAIGSRRATQMIPCERRHRGSRSTAAGDQSPSYTRTALLPILVPSLYRVSPSNPYPDTIYRSYLRRGAYGVFTTGNASVKGRSLGRTSDATLVTPKNP